MKKIIFLICCFYLVGCGKSQEEIAKEKQAQIEIQKAKVEAEKNAKEEAEIKKKNERIEQAKNQDEHCRDFILISGKIMEARQGGMPFEDSLKSADNYFKETSDEYRYAIMKRMISEAYQQPLYSDSDYRHQQLENFKSEWYEGCIESFDIERKRKQAN